MMKKLLFNKNLKHFLLQCFCLTLLTFLYSCSSYIRTPEITSWAKLEKTDQLRTQKTALYIDSFDEEKDSQLLEETAQAIYQQYQAQGFSVLSAGEFTALMEKHNLSKDDWFDSKKRKLFQTKLQVSQILLITSKQEEEIPLENPGVYVEAENDSLVVHQGNLTFKLLDLSSGNILGALNLIKMPDHLKIHRGRDFGPGFIFYGVGGGILAIGLFIDAIVNGLDGLDEKDDPDTHNGITTAAIIAAPIILGGIIYQAAKHTLYQYDGDGWDQNEIYKSLNNWLGIQIPLKAPKPKKEVVFKKKENKNNSVQTEENKNAENIQFKF